MDWQHYEIYFVWTDAMFYLIILKAGRSAWHMTVMWEDSPCYALVRWQRLLWSAANLIKNLQTFCSVLHRGDFSCREFLELSTGCMEWRYSKVLAKNEAWIVLYCWDSDISLGTFPNPILNCWLGLKTLITRLLNSDFTTNYFSDIV